MFSETNFLFALGWALVHSLWQMAFFWIFSQVAITTLSRISAAKKVQMAVFFLLTGFISFAFTLLYGLMGDSGQDVLIISISNTLPAFDKFVPFIALTYLLFLLFSLSRFIKNYRYVRAIKTLGLTKVNVQWRMFARRIATQLSIKKDVQIWFSEFVSSPVTVGFLKPLILLPVASLNGLSISQVEAILLHELAHIKRNDYLINLLINLIKSILFFNPFVSAFIKIVEQEREKSCDELVLQFQYPAHEYAAALLTIQQQNKPQRIFALPATGRFNLLQRVELILGAAPRKSFSAKGIFSFLVATTILISSFYLGKKEINTVAKSDYISFQPKIITEVPVSVSADYDHQSHKSSSLKKATVKSNKITPNAEVEEELSIPFNIPVASTSDNLFAFYIKTHADENAIALKKYQQNQVKDAIASSKRVIEDLNWKKIEKEIAEVLNPIEKAELKKKYEAELNKMDWAKWEQRLSEVYNRIDWNKVNEQLQLAVNNIQMDSIQQVYNVALSKLDKLQGQLSANALSHIPDTEITPELIERKKKEALELLKKVAESRKKKIVRL